VPTLDPRRQLSPGSLAAGLALLDRLQTETDTFDPAPVNPGGDDIHQRAAEGRPCCACARPAVVALVAAVNRAGMADHRWLDLCAEDDHAVREATDYWRAS
jgi:hypothetical protein